MEADNEEDGEAEAGEDEPAMTAAVPLVASFAFPAEPRAAAAGGAADEDACMAQRNTTQHYWPHTATGAAISEQSTCQCAKLVAGDTTQQSINQQQRWQRCNRVIAMLLHNHSGEWNMQGSWLLICENSEIECDVTRRQSKPLKSVEAVFRRKVDPKHQSILRYHGSRFHRMHPRLLRR